MARQDILQTIKDRAHNNTLRAMLRGECSITLTLEERDVMGDEATDWCRRKGLDVEATEDGVVIRAKRQAEDVPTPFANHQTGERTMTTQPETTKRYHVTTTEPTDLNTFGTDVGLTVASSNVRVSDGYLTLLDVTGDDACHGIVAAALNAMSDVVSFRTTSR